MKVPEINELFTDIYNSTYSDVLKFVVIKCHNLDDIPDLMQNIYMNFYKRFKAKGDIKEPKRYAIKIAKHELFKYYGIFSFTKNFIPVFSQPEDETLINFDEGLYDEEFSDDKLICNDIWQYLKERDILTFKIFILYYSDDLKICDISKSLGISESMVKNRLYRTLKEINDKFSLQEE